MTPSDVLPFLDAFAGWGTTEAGGVGWSVAAVGLAVAGWQRLRLQRVAALVAEAAHEVRNPLCAARLALDLQLDGAPDRTSSLVAASSALRRAALAVEDLTAAVRVGRTPSALERFDPADVVSEAYVCWRAVAAARGVRLIERPSWQGRDLHICGDRRRVQQAYDNLVANAIEHGGHDVGLALEFRAGRVRLTVSDDGAGLPESLPMMLRRRRSLRTRGHGLAIADRVARENGGALAAQASHDVHRIWLEFPLVTRAPSAPAISVRRSRPAPGPLRLSPPRSRARAFPRRRLGT